MEESVAIVALVGGILALLGSVFGAVTTLAKLVVSGYRARKHSHKLEVTIDGHKYIIDVSSIDREDPQKIEAATRAVKAAAPVEVAA